VREKGRAPNFLVRLAGRRVSIPKISWKTNRHCVVSALAS